MSFRLPRIYPITDQQVSGLSHAEQVALLAEGGATLIQLRDKTSPPKEFYEGADRALTVARACGVKIIINDRVDLAMSLGADGVHLGQTDMPPRAARRLMGPTALIGFSTHNLEQALAATDEPVDYIAFGPIFQTSSKTDSESPVGLSQLTKVRGLIHTQLVAIGGITHANAETVVAAGADSLAVMSSVLAGRHEIPSRLRRLRQLLKLDIPE